MNGNHPGGKKNHINLSEFTMDIGSKTVEFQELPVELRAKEK